MTIRRGDEEVSDFAHRRTLRVHATLDAGLVGDVLHNEHTRARNATDPDHWRNEELEEVPGLLVIIIVMTVALFIGRKADEPLMFTLSWLVVVVPLLGLGFYVIDPPIHWLAVGAGAAARPNSTSPTRAVRSLRSGPTARSPGSTW